VRSYNGIEIFNKRNSVVGEEGAGFYFSVTGTGKFGRVVFVLLKYCPKIAEITHNLLRSETHTVPHGLKLTSDSNVKAPVQSTIQSPISHVQTCIRLLELSDT
jgi:hypothetical protein